MPLVSYWDGPVKWLERLCVRSMREAGHPVILFGHDVAALEREGLGASEIHDAREILAEDHPANRYRRPYEGTDVAEKAMQAYLDWEYGLVEQLRLDGTHGFYVI